MKYLKIFIVILYCCVNITKSKQMLVQRELQDSIDNIRPLFSIKCFWWEEKTGQVYDLNNLNINKKYYNEKDYTYEKETLINNRKILFNFCGNTKKSCNNISSQISYYDSDDKCENLAGPISQSNNWTLINPNNPEEGLKIILNPGDSCTSLPFLTKSTYSTTFIMRCNKYMREWDFNLTSTTNLGNNLCTKTIEFESYEACPKLNFYAIWGFLLKNSVIFGGALIVIGLFEVLFGAKLMIFTLFIATCIVTTTIVMLLIPSETETGVIWILFGLSLIVGLVFGYFVAKYNRVILGFILGGYTGYIFGIMIYNMIFIHINASPNLIFWVTIILSIIICCLLAYFLFPHILIISTSFCGAYALIRGISLYAGGFPNESYVIDLIKNEETEMLESVLTNIVLVYLAAWIVVFIFGIFFQYKTRSDDDKNKLTEGNTNKTNFIDEKDTRNINLNLQIKV